MTLDQLLILIILAITIVLFIWGPWRHDMVALSSLLVCVFFGLIPPEKAFAGFGHPAVVTVACVLILSRGLQNTGAMGALAQRVVPRSGNITISMLLLTGLGALLSGFMNNVGALALLMPVAADMAEKQGLAPGKVLMPLSFATILGGMTTLIGTPPNLVVSGFRDSAGAGSYGMFDFTPVGLVVTLVGLLFIGLLGWRLVPGRGQTGAASFDTGTYLTEALVGEKSAAVGKSLGEIGKVLSAEDAQVVGLVQSDARVAAVAPWQRVQSGDILVIEAEPESLAASLSRLGLKMVGGTETEKDKKVVVQLGGAKPLEDTDGRKKDQDKDKGVPAGEEMQLRELVVMPDSFLVGRSIQFVHLSTRYQINLLALSRRGRRSVRRLRSTPLQAGDALLMMGPDDNLSNFARDQGCVPLAQRDIGMPNKEKAAIALIAMALGVAGAAFGLVPAAVSFATCVLAFMALKVVPLRNIYEALDGSVIVLLGTLIAVAEVIERTGAADLVAQVLLDNLAQGSSVVALALILIITMTLSDFMNNVATAAVMCSIAISTAEQLAVNPDSFLMAVAIGASCAFLTPVGHQNNTLILGPGGFDFGDYWRMGLPLEILVVVVSIPMLLWVWPL
ncbi:SLC13 family permease [Microbulbifer sp. THAF38]|uniref:SLC13 family permease n=1 Tax=Microbulbifer sp. THAF38 TaxID=2587856 RepID=UPI0012686CDF|nr:SLC13 family permease [Microbulbifer sp. THAF38]QFT56507.1 Citrate transporter [Microbulbifer sp. THAF38]